MQEKLGIILLDGNEVTIRIYERERLGQWKLLSQHDRDLTTFDTHTNVKTADIVEVIVQVSLSRYGGKVDDWRIIARNMDQEIAEQVGMATGIQAEFLLLQREQELLCKGALIELG